MTPLVHDDEGDSVLVSDAHGSVEEEQEGVSVVTGRVTIAAGGAHSAVIAVNGKCYTFGANEFGQLGRSLLHDGDDDAICDVTEWENTENIQRLHTAVRAFIEMAQVAYCIIASSAACVCIICP
jgi:alpha-tubulin suppressor-like RCC1 family protein